MKLDETKKITKDLSNRGKKFLKICNYWWCHLWLWSLRHLC